MPTYEFRCPAGHEFEKFYRSIGGAESQAACPHCGQPAERMMSAAGFAFKGSGFYLTDYGKNAHRGEAPPTANPGASASNESSSNESSSDSSKSDGATGDAAPSAKTESATTGGGKSTESTGSARESKKTDATKTEPKVESKSAPTTPKPGANE